MARHTGPIEVDHIYLYEENPRHEPIKSEPEIIEYLCRDEQVLNLARNIAKFGTNPLESLGLVYDTRAGKKAGSKRYLVWEGNRRVCAIKLLNDPDRAPARLRNDFERLAANSKFVPIRKINSVVFDDRGDLKHWMGIIHDGTQGGVGRLPWDADQKARHFGTANRNSLALEVLDIAEKMKLISKEERDGKLTTAQRFLNSSVVRDAIGIDNSNPGDIAYDRPVKDLEKQLAIFIADLKSGAKVNSRNNRAQIDAYGRKLASNEKISGRRVKPESLSKAKIAKKAAAKTTRRSKPKPPKKRDTLEYNKDLALALEAFRSSKLENLYYSICTVQLEHTPLLTVGVWSFIESLCAAAGKNENTDFVSFNSKDRLEKFGFKEKTSIREALNRIQKNGNSTKHHEIGASFDGAQLSNDLETVTPLLVKTVEALPRKK